MNAPRKNAITPPAVRTPCVGAKTSMTNKANAKTINAIPAMLIGTTVDM